MDSLKNVLLLMPSNLRLTIVDHDGKFLYDNSLDKEQGIENHLLRPDKIIHVVFGKIIVLDPGTFRKPDGGSCFLD